MMVSTVSTPLHVAPAQVWVVMKWTRPCADRLQ